MNDIKAKREFNSQLVDFLSEYYCKFDPVVDLPVKEFFKRKLRNKNGRKEIRKMMNHWLISKYRTKTEKAEIRNVLQIMDIVYPNER